MGSKFGLVILLARFLPPAELGLYGLLVVSVAFGVVVLGGDFYSYAHRHLLGSPKSEHSHIVLQQVIGNLILYPPMLALMGLLFVFDLLPRSVAVWFFALLVVEHISQEIYRLIVVLRHPVLAGMLLFVRQGSWVLALVPMLWFTSSTRDLHFVLAAWTMGGVLSVVLGGVCVARLVPSWSIVRVDWQWLRRGYLVAVKFLIATMCFRFLQTADRYVVEWLMNPDFLGAYVLFAGIALALTNLLEPAVFSFLYPPLVAALRNGEAAEFSKVFRRLWVATLALTMAMVLLVVLLIGPTLEWIGKPLYREQMSLLWILLLAAILYAASAAIHYAIYARGEDVTIVAAHVSAIPVFAIAIALSAAEYPHFAAAIGMAAAFAWIGLVKLWRYINPRQALLVSKLDGGTV